MPTPCAGSRSPDAARGSRARAPLCARAPPLLHRTADPGHAQPAAPSGAVSRPSSRSSRQSSGSPTIAKCARLGGSRPSEPREHGPHGNMGELASSWLHPLKSWSLRKTRYGSIAIAPAIAEAERQRAMRRPPESLDAWAAYQRGLWHLSKVTVEDFTIALKLFETGTHLDPGFAGCYSGLALGRLQASAVYQLVDPVEAQSSAELFARRAVA